MIVPSPGPFLYRSTILSRSSYTLSAISSSFITPTDVAHGQQRTRSGGSRVSAIFGYVGHGFRREKQRPTAAATYRSEGEFANANGTAARTQPGSRAAPIRFTAVPFRYLFISFSVSLLSLRIPSETAACSLCRVPLTTIVESCVYMLIE